MTDDSAFDLVADGSAARARTATTLLVLAEVRDERRAQDSKWGEQNHPDGTGDPDDWSRWIFAADDQRERTEEAFARNEGTWADILAEEVAEAVGEHDPARLRAELVQVAAVAVAWIEAIDRRRSEDSES